MRALVTGGSGFVGRQIVAALLTANVEVHAASRKPLSLDCASHQVDLLDFDQVRRLAHLVRPDVVVHAAWCVEHGQFWTDPANVAWADASLVLASACFEAGAHRFVGVGTCYEYDWPADGDCIEAATPLGRHTPYDIAKTECRERLSRLTAGAGVQFGWARLFSIYGPHEDSRRLVAAVARALSRGEPATCSSGLAVRDFMDVRDVGAALAAVAQSSREGAFNVASGRGVSVAQMATMLGRISGRPHLVKLGALADRPDEPPRIVADVTRLSDEIGFLPRYDLEAGLTSALDYWSGR